MIIETQRNSAQEPILQALHFGVKDVPFKNLIVRQRIIIILCCIIIVLLLLLGLFAPKLITKQTGLIALIDTVISVPDIPGPDPDAIDPSDDDIIDRLDKKLDKGMMCVNMAGSIVFKNAYSSGRINYFNDDGNNYPQFVTITLDSNDMQVYQSGLVDVGKCIPYINLDVVLPAGTHACTATFAQVDPETNAICGMTAAKVQIVIKGET